MSYKKTLKKLLPAEVVRQIEPFGHLLEAVYFSNRYGRPARKLRVIGVTGTNGKTTTCFMIYQMLRAANQSVAIMTTVAYGYNDKITPQAEHMTTVSSALLNKRIKELASKGVEWLILETTSHALAQHRVYGVPYEVAVLTNITHEHLDYHKTFARYLSAKRKLFELANHHPHGYGVVNADDPNAAAFTSAIRASTTYGIEQGAIQAESVKSSANGSDFSVKTANNIYHIHCNIPGLFNVSNCLAAVAVGEHIGLSKLAIEQGISDLKAVEGRMNTIHEGQKFTVIIDFAHTPDSFERLLSDLRKSTKGKLIVMFGSAGRRDEAKRYTQGEIAGKYADELVLTEEDDRDIDGSKILSQIAEGANRSGKTAEKDMWLVLDRPSAIKFALSRASAASDTVVFLGKGHEKTIERADGEHPWNETAEVKKAIRASM